MSYNPTNWQDRVVEHPRRFEVQNNPDGTVTLIPKPGTVLQEGTPVNAANMNKLEQGLAAHTADSMPHRFVDNGKTYRWGFRTLNGQPQFIYEEVVG